MIISLNFIDSDVSTHYYIFIIDSVYYCIRIYVTFINMCTLSMKYINNNNILALITGLSDPMYQML